MFPSWKERSALPTRKVSQTLIRTVTGIVLLAVFVACMCFSVSSVLFFTAVGCIACWEIANALHAMQIRCSPWPSMILLVLISVSMLFRPLLELPDALMLAMIALGIDVISVLAYALFHKVKFENVLGTLALFLYPMVFFLLFAYVGSKELVQRIPIIAVVIVSASLCDIAAYFIGRWLGKHKMAPKVSPKKTIEGSVAGLIFGTLSGFGLYFALNPLLGDAQFPLALYLIASFLCSVAGEIGDLCASMLKRQADVKDYGKILPGHGGIMDRADSFVFALPVALLCFELYLAFVK